MFRGSKSRRRGLPSALLSRTGTPFLTASSKSYYSESFDKDSEPVDEVVVRPFGTALPLRHVQIHSLSTSSSLYYQHDSHPHTEDRCQEVRFDYLPHEAKGFPCQCLLFVGDIGYTTKEIFLGLMLTQRTFRRLRNLLCRCELAFFAQLP